MISRFAYNYLQCTLNRERFFSPYDFEGFKAATTRVAPSTVPRAPYLVYFNGVARYSFPRNSAPWTGARGSKSRELKELKAGRRYEMSFSYLLLGFS